MTNWRVNSLNPNSSLEQEGQLNDKARANKAGIWFIPTKLWLHFEASGPHHYWHRIVNFIKVAPQTPQRDLFSFYCFSLRCVLLSFRFCIHSPHSIFFWHLDIFVICFSSCFVWRWYVLLRPLIFSLFHLHKQINCFPCRLCFSVCILTPTFMTWLLQINAPLVLGWGTKRQLEGFVMPLPLSWRRSPSAALASKKKKYSQDSIEYRKEWRN